MSSLYRYKDKDFFLSHSLDEIPNPANFVMHTHGTIELYHFIRGKGVFHVEGSAYALEPGDLMVMKPSESHYIELDISVPYERAVLNLSPEVFASVDPEGVLMKAVLERRSGKLNQYRGFDFSGGCSQYWQQMLNRESDRRINLLCGLLPMLREVYNIFTERSTDLETESDTLEYRVIRYVKENITKPLTLDEICQRHFISKSQLCRLFKQSTGSTVWQYITVKRLVKARQLLEAGESPTHIYARCGFNDYSTFYRAYVKYYGHAPRDNI